MVVDELVTLIGFNMPASAKAALASAERSVDRVTSAVKSLGIASTVTSGVMAALTIHGGKEAANFTRLASSINGSVEEIQALESAFLQVGGKAEAFAADAQKYFATTGRTLNIEEMKRLSEVFKELPPNLAQQLGIAYGFSWDMVQVLKGGPEEIQKMTDKARALGHIVGDETTKRLTELNTQWNSFTNTLSVLSMDVQAEFAPHIKKGLEWLQQFLLEHKEEIIGGANDVAEAIRDMFSWLNEHPDTVKLIGEVGVALLAYKALTIPASLVTGMKELGGTLPMFAMHGNAAAFALSSIAFAYIRISDAVKEREGALETLRKTTADLSADLGRQMAVQKDLGGAGPDSLQFLVPAGLLASDLVTQAVKSGASQEEIDQKKKDKAELYGMFRDSMKLLTPELIEKHRKSNPQFNKVYERANYSQYVDNATWEMMEMEGEMARAQEDNMRNAMQLSLSGLADASRFRYVDTAKRDMSDNESGTSVINDSLGSFTLPASGSSPIPKQMIRRRGGNERNAPEVESRGFTGNNGDTNVTVNVYPQSGDPRAIGDAAAQGVVGVIAPGRFQMSPGW
jgi:hypothetical protein